jgi:predicted DNA-binding WGR domain protein
MGKNSQDWFNTEEEAWVAGQKLREAKQKKGYQSILTEK